MLLKLEKDASFQNEKYKAAGMVFRQSAKKGLKEGNQSYGR